jgi:DUF1680 family protein
MRTPTRRTVLAGMAAAAATLALPRTGLGMVDAALASAPGKADDFIWTKSSGAAKLQPFPMTAVRLLPGYVQQQAEINQRYLDSLSTDRLLHSFRLTAGITSTAAPYGGWEKPDADLRGHFNGGHYLSAVALAYASSGNDALRRNGDTMVAELARCQKAIGSSGFLSAYPEAQFEALARGSNKWSGGTVWAPFYTYHKIMAGLVDMYVHTGNEQALHTAESMAQWINAYFEGIGDDQRQRMLRIEYGGMNEVLANLYGITGREQYLHTAHLFEQPAFLDSLAQHRDDLKGLHANTHVPKVIGAARMYELTGETRYRDIATYFLDEVLTERNYCIGNCSNGEFWRNDPGDLKGSLNYHDAECCVAYNLMKLDRHAFSWTGDARSMDAYERSLWNARMGTQNADGLKQYFFPLAAGYWRHFNSPENSFWCCTGSGAEEFAKFTDTIYFYEASQSPLGFSVDVPRAIWINQFISSELTWKEAGLVLRQQTGFPAEQGTTITIKAGAPVSCTINLRIPGWAASGGSVKINGTKLDAFGQPGSYLALTRDWRNGDKIELSLPIRVTTESLPGDPTLRAALYGPLVLATTLGPGPTGPLRIGGYDSCPKDKDLGPTAEAPVAPLGKSDSDWIEVASAKNLTFKTAAATPVQPLYRVTDQRYAVYWDTGKKA